MLHKAPDAHNAFHHFELFTDRLLKNDKSIENLLSLDQTDVLGPMATLLGSGSYMWEQLLKMQYSTLSSFLKNRPRLKWKQDWKEKQATITAQMSDEPDTEIQKKNT